MTVQRDKTRRQGTADMTRRLFATRRFRLQTLVASLAASALFGISAPAAVAEPAAPAIELHATAMPTNTAPAADASDRLIVTATGGTYTLSVNRPGSETVAHTQPISFDAPASTGSESVEAKLEAAIGSGNVSATGPVGGPYTITFIGSYGDFPINLAADSDGLTGPGGASASIEPITTGSDGKGSLALLGVNVGGSPTDGSEIVVTDTLPEGVAITGAFIGTTWGGFAPGSCVESSPRVATCSLFGNGIPDGQSGFNVRIAFEVEPSAPEGAPLTDRAEVSGGEAAHVGTSAPIVISPDPAPPGLASVLFNAVDASGAPMRQAGAHPNLLFSGFDADNRFLPGGSIIATRRPKDVVVDLPLGFLGDPGAAAVCPEFNVIIGNGFRCRPASKIGFNYFSANAPAYEETEAEGEGTAISFLFNTLSPRGFPAEFGAGKNNIPAPIYSTVAHTPAGYVLRTFAPNIPRAAELKSVLLAIFGDPNARNELEPEIPFFTMPSDCSAAGLKAAFHADFYGNEAVLPLKPDGTLDFEAADFNDPQWSNQSVEFPTPTGCNKLHFETSTFEARPTTDVADSPSGLDVNLQIPQPEEMETPSTPPLKDATVTLPEGLVVDPSSADGLEGCTEAQIALESTQPGNCPDASKIGNVELETPLLAERNEQGEATSLRVLGGAMFLGTPECAPCGNSDAEAGRLVRLYLEINDPQTGTFIKVPGSARLDPATGQVKAVFDQQPQLPFSSLKVHLFGGNRGSLTTPPTCGPYETTSVLTPWSAPESGPPAEPSDHYAIAAGPNGQGCRSNESELPDSPRFEAGTTSTQAGAYAPFVLKLSREDGSQRLTRLNLTLPPGLTGRLAGVSYCPEAAIKAAEGTPGGQQIISPSCPASSELGTVNVAAGSGPTPFHVSGHAYLAGPYKGAPLSMVIITPAKAGPFDLGTVVVRSALHLDPYTTQITVNSDPIPTILAGIPLDVRQITVDISRNEFTRNPTDCEKMALGGEALTILGQSASLSDPFQVGGCKGLTFKPSLKLALKGATRRSGHPALRATLRMKSGEANIARAQVSLPHALFLDQGNLDKVCTQPEIAAASCPPGSVYGHAIAWSPLLDQPLEGPVFLGVGYGHELPDLVAELNGQIRVLLHGKVDTDKADGIRNTFEVVPDAPVSRFVLELKGGRRYGLIENHENLCLRPHRASARFVGQNGKVDVFGPVIGTKCPKKKGHRRGHKGHGH